MHISDPEDSLGTYQADAGDSPVGRRGTLMKHGDVIKLQPSKTKDERNEKT